MRELRGYLILAGVLGGLILVGFIFKWLGLLHWWDMTWEVVLRATVLSVFAFVAYALTAGTWGSDNPRDIWLRFIVFILTLLAAAGVMAFWDQWLARGQ